MLRNGFHRSGQGVRIAFVLLAAFAIPVAVVVVGFAKTGVYPFGTRSYLSIDGIHQYLPFFTELYHKLHNGQNLFYSWNGGLGYDFWAVFSYYLASPWNCLLFFCPEDSLNEGVTLLVLGKTGLCGLSMAASLLCRSRGAADTGAQDGKGGSQNGKGELQNGKGGPQQPAEPAPWIFAALFGIMYGLSNYVIGYHINVMWMDCVILLPWLSLSVRRLVMDDKGGWYSVILALSISSNYYIGIGVCLFCVIAYGMVAIGEKRVRSTIWRFVLHSLLGGFAAALVWIPALYQLLGTRAASTLSQGEYGIIANVWYLLSQLLPGTKAVMTTGESDLANIYCGVCALLFALLYFLRSDLPRRVRLVRAAGLALLFLTFAIGLFNQLFHGFHAGYGFPNRHAFLFLFLLLLTGYEGVCGIRTLANRRFALAVTGSLILVGAAGLAGRCGGVRIGAGLGILALLSVFLFLMRTPSLHRWEKLVPCAIFLVIAAELSGNALYSIQENGNADRDYLMERYQYVTGYLQENADPDSFYRADVSQPVSRNESLLYGQKGIALFSSTVDSDVVDAMHHLGFYTSLNRIQYIGYSDVTNMLFGVRYTEKLNRLSNKNTYSPITDDDIMVKNELALGVGYLVNRDTVGVTLTDDNPFSNQNALLYGMTGETLYETQELQPAATHFLQKAGRHYYFYLSDGGDRGQQGESESNLQEVTLDGVTYDSELSRIYDLGTAEEDKEVEFCVKTSGQGDCRIFIGSYEQSELQAIEKVLSAGNISIEAIQDGALSGSVCCEQDQMLFFSIPYSTGFRVVVDGENVEPVCTAGAFLGVPLTKGEHTVTLTYHTPGFGMGLAVTLISLAALWKFPRTCDRIRKIYNAGERRTGKERV